MALFYRDFLTGKQKWTRGKPVGVTRGGPLNAWYLIVKRPRSELLIPEYCLIGASQTHFRELKRKKEEG